MVFLENKMFQKKDGVNPVDLFDMKHQKGKKNADIKIKEEYKIVEPEFRYSGKWDRGSLVMREDSKEDERSSLKCGYNAKGMVFKEVLIYVL